MQKKKSWVLISQNMILHQHMQISLTSATTMGGVTTETIDVTDLRDKKLAPVIGVQRNRWTLYKNPHNYVKEDRFAILKDAKSQIGVTGMTVSHVMGCGTQKGKTDRVSWC